MPAPPPRSQTGALLDGFRLLARRPAWTLGLIALGTLLSQLGPALEIAAKAGEDPLVRQLLGAVATLPLIAYLIPRWLVMLDAENAQNLSDQNADWGAVFEKRWVRAFLVRTAIQIIAVLLLVTIIPSVVILTFLGFAPLRILLRGGSTPEALRWSARSMARHWPRVAQAALLIALVSLVLLLPGLLFEQIHFPPESTSAHMILKSPAIWGITAGTILVVLWYSASFLSLYQRLEKLVALSPDSPGPRAQ